MLNLSTLMKVFVLYSLLKGIYCLFCCVFWWTHDKPVWKATSPSTPCQVLRSRVSIKAHLDLSGELPSFLKGTAHIRQDPNWRVDPVPPRLRRRHVDIGDLAPCDTERFIQGLQSPAQGLQVPVTTTIMIIAWIYIASFWVLKTLYIEPISLAANQMVQPFTNQHSLMFVEAVWLKCLVQGKQDLNL